ncbi:Zinc finger protein VAR3, chloroplastic [Apostasia shenzhenica]|uniref:Zinc finger protein VAR3, chloroplastic n=1 Tax=Apostasia shenzhenica TaxID=1088818 RepID=A0A2I0A9Z3_9ASPA|nr:Zinc finger protein VAR3, chloroplastic [Apostasia shenzhenica]
MFSGFSRARLRLARSVSSLRPAAADCSRLDFLRREVEELKFSKPIDVPAGERRGKPEEDGERERSIEISHPWPEWVELMDHLLKRGLLDRAAFQSFSSSCSSSKDSNQIRTACLNLARERSELIRYLPRKDIRTIVVCGCPSIDRKVVSSGKRLRAFVGVDEGEVCSACKLRGSCERAYVKAQKDERGRTSDVMRIILTYGLDVITSPAENKLCLNKSVKESVRKLLKDILDLVVEDNGSNHDNRRPEIAPYAMGRSKISVPMKQGDWICPKCNFLNFAKNVKCLRCDGVFQERLAKLREREDGDHLPLKKGDWICEKCNFLNFARNVKCLQCNEKAANRLLNPGEWECESCSYINFRRNYFCLKCGWKRPKAASTGDAAAAADSHYSTVNQSKPSDSSSPRFIHRNTREKEESLEPRSSRKYRFCADDDIVGDNDNNESDKFGNFDEFPIVGGKTAISNDPMARDRWKEEMLRRSKEKVAGRISNEKEEEEEEEEDDDDDDDVSCSSFFVASDESVDDDDIAGWFGYKNGRYV